MWQKQAYCRPTSFLPLPSNYQEQEAQGRHSIGGGWAPSGALQRPSPTWWIGSWLLIQDDRMHSTQHSAMWINFTWADIVSKTWTTKFCQIPHINMCLGMIAPWNPHWQHKATETEKIIERVNVSKTGILEMRMDKVSLSQNLPILSQVERLKKSTWRPEFESKQCIWEVTPGGPVRANCLFIILLAGNMWGIFPLPANSPAFQTPSGCPIFSSILTSVTQS